MAKKKTMMKPAKRKSGTTPLTSTQKSWLKKETAKRKKASGSALAKKPTAAEARRATARKKK